ncbi:MAG TPA: hypothetical protein VMV33_17215 [Rhodocyclaceae bacterium]|nr:hypothetical protein [Rhodocyclaceae bacterium]
MNAVSGYSSRGMPTVNAFFDSDAFFRGLMGPFGSGKSSACVWDIVQRGLRQAPGEDGVRRSRWAVIRNSYQQLEDTTQKTFFQWFSPHIHGEWRSSKHDFIIRSLKASHNEPPAEIEIMFRALDRPDQMGKLLSTEYTGGWINEGREVPWAIYDALSGRVGRYPAMRDGGATWSGIIADTNPPDNDSEWYRFFEERKGHEEAIEALAKVIPGGMDLDRFSAVFKQPSGLAPNAENLTNLPPGYYQRLAIGKSPDWVKVYVKGEYGFTTDGKPVFPEYSDALHCPADKALWPKVVKGVEVIRSWDFGLTPACIYSQITANGRWNILDEQVATRMGADSFSDEVLSHSGREFRGCTFLDVGDIAGKQGAQTDERTCFDILHGKGIMIQAAPQTLALRLDGTRRPMRMLVDGRPQFTIHPRCKVTRRGLQGGYHFRRLRISGETYSTLPNKNQYSHPCDALGYAGAWLFGDEVRGRLVDPSEEASTALLNRDRTRNAVTGY